MGKHNQGVIDQALSDLRNRLPAAERTLTESFVRQYYRGLAPEDLVGRAPADLLGAALCHLELARTRRGVSRRLRIYNPDPNKHGWRSQHTIIEIVSPDTPFLVDSAGGDQPPRIHPAPGHSPHLMDQARSPRPTHWDIRRRWSSRILHAF